MSFMSSLVTGIPVRLVISPLSRELQRKVEVDIARETISNQTLLSPCW